MNHSTRTVHGCWQEQLKESSRYIYIQFLLKYQALTSLLRIYDSGKYLHKQKRLTIRLFTVTAYTLINLIFLENGNEGNRVCVETFQSKIDAITPTVSIQQNHFTFSECIKAFLGHLQRNQCLRNTMIHQTQQHA